LVREGDADALAFLNSIPPQRMRAKVRAGAKPWNPRLVKAATLEQDWADKGITSFFRGGHEVEQERVDAGGPGGGQFGSGGGDKETGTKDWSPHMTAEQAAKWQEENGAGPPRGALYHGTEAWRADKIAESGFRTVGPASNGHVYGQGAYLTTSENLAHWKYASGKDDGTLETRVCLTHPATLGESMAVFDAVRNRDPEPSSKDYPRLVSEEAQRRGFDALRVEYYEPVMGRTAGAATNYIIFDPHKITVVDK
jgi:hypothetical protein